MTPDVTAPAEQPTPARHELVAEVARDGSIRATDNGGRERVFGDKEAVYAYMRERQREAHWLPDVPYVVIFRESPVGGF